MPKRKGFRKIDPYAFIEAWQTSDFITQVSKKTGLSKNTIRSRAHLYKRKGVLLKTLLDGRFDDGIWDWEALSRFARGFLGRKA